MNTSDQYVEIARFKTKAGFTHEDFLKAEEKVRQGMLKTFPGYLSRELYRSEDGEWVVILRFSDKASMDALIETLRLDPDESFKDYGSMIDRATMRLEFVWMQR
jgi:antibiotic biosynthesis monooxygenase (ABM) superfamily enzyme